MDAQIEDKAKHIANINQIKERIEKRRQQIGEMNKFKSALVDTEGMLRNRLIASINSMMQSVWSEIYPYADYTGIRLDAGKDDYRLEASTVKRTTRRSGLRSTAWQAAARGAWHAWP